ncbi:3-carboxy-cis,cis-muconate cycloisomerase [Antricoccus suffuscus]|uniref:3-carboxy-cis,cis-muconate cycloisomerase n=1 Tax=Antricoccus suffuscus TaxID=1629062 RepID=A0A2T1A2B9_9ACTN|nr:adenylosuccinate lyase family protein [Antricoccus suffuscus]PRZ42478.1 3-carboxy-cis,cis-muconate cycloisomerase [Antricoccus suffuscus]
MSPSSSSSESLSAPYDGLLGSLPGDALVDAAIGDAALVSAMLRVEATMASAQAATGLIPQSSADVIATVVADAHYDVRELGRAAVAAGNPVVPLASWLTRDVRARDASAAAHVHFGTTSQDILDTALMLIARDAVAVILDRLDACSGLLVSLAREHARALMTGRSLGQIAAPITFGLKAVGWLGGVDAARDRLEAASSRFAVQLGGPVGTRVAWGAHAPRLAASVASALGLADAPPWHTERSRIVDLASALGQVVAALGTIATDVILLSQNEIGELSESPSAGRGSSSAMPHKRNPIGSILVRSATLQSPGLVSTLLAAAVHDNERAAGAWHAEWTPLRELLHLAGGAGAEMSGVLSGLVVHADTMRENVTGRGSVMFAESVARALMRHVDRAEAQSIVADASVVATSSGRSLRDVLEDSPASGHLSAEDLDAAFDPTDHIDAAARLVEQTLGART